ncbi:hypothetical protein ES703_80308 [subsurface metagenome]
MPAEPVVAILGRLIDFACAIISDFLHQLGKGVIGVDDFHTVRCGFLDAVAERIVVIDSCLPGIGVIHIRLCDLLIQSTERIIDIIGCNPQVITTQRVIINLLPTGYPAHFVVGK